MRVTGLSDAREMNPLLRIDTHGRSLPLNDPGQRYWGYTMYATGSWRPGLYRRRFRYGFPAKNPMAHVDVSAGFRNVNYKQKIV